MMLAVLWLACLPATADTTTTVELPPSPVAEPDPGRTLIEAFPAPWQSKRVDGGAYGAWLRDLPLKPPGSPVRSYQGDVVGIPAARVVDWPVTLSTLQCADSAIRLRATWLRSVGRDPVFHYTSGDPSRWADWARGMRPVVRGSDVRWTLARGPDRSDAAFEAWLADLYTYAGSASLPRDTVPVTEPEPGDLFVTPGSPGHVVVVLDVATDGPLRWVLVGQGYMPAMDFHVLPGPDAGWFPVEGASLPSQPIPMPWSSLRRWREDVP